MVVAVSIIFSICWMTDAVIFLLSYHSTSNSPSDVTWTIAAVMILLNSAVNPFVYGLINQRFREKIKGMLYCMSRSSNEIHITGETMEPLPGNSTTHPTQLVELCFKEWPVCIIWQHRSVFIVIRNILEHVQGWCNILSVSCFRRLISISSHVFNMILDIQEPRKLYLFLFQLTRYLSFQLSLAYWQQLPIRQSVFHFMPCLFLKRVWNK